MFKLSRRLVIKIFITFTLKTQKLDSQNIDEIRKITNTLIERILFSPTSTKSFSARFLKIGRSNYVVAHCAKAF